MAGPEEAVKQSHLRFLSTDGPLVPITASAEVLLLGPQDLLESADIRAGKVEWQEGERS